MTHSTKRTIKTVVILGWTILGPIVSAVAQIPQDPYPLFGRTSQQPVLTAQRHAVQSPMLPDFSPSAVSSQSSYQNSSRSQRLERIAQDADRHTRKAFSLASRGAYYSARAELVRALRLVAQGLDSERQCRAYSEALGSGLKALEEVDDFIPTGSQLESDLPLREIISRHQTTVLKHTLCETSGLLPTPMEAVGAYLRYAQEQLSTAVGGEVAGSMALHGLGKLYATKKGTELDISISRAIICYKTAITVCPQNYIIRNDLGVLLAHSDRPEDARKVLEESVAIHPHPTTIANLASIYQMLGEAQLFEAMQKHLSAYKKSMPVKSGSVPTVDWLTPDRFAQSYATTPDARQLPPVREPGEKTTKTPTPAKQADRSWPWSWITR